MQTVINILQHHKQHCSSNHFYSLNYPLRKHMFMNIDLADRIFHPNLPSLKHFLSLNLRCTFPMTDACKCSINQISYSDIFCLSHKLWCGVSDSYPAKESPRDGRLVSTFKRETGTVHYQWQCITVARPCTTADLQLLAYCRADGPKHYSNGQRSMTAQDWWLCLNKSNRICIISRRYI